MRENIFSEEEVDNFRAWLGEEGIRYFRHLKGLTGTVIPVLRLNYRKKGIPTYPVHFREGKTIRNWIRLNTEIGKNISSSELDDCYYEIIEKSIK